MAATHRASSVMSAQDEQMPALQIPWAPAGPAQAAPFPQLGATSGPRSGMVSATARNIALIGGFAGRHDRRAERGSEMQR